MNLEYKDSQLHLLWTGRIDYEMKSYVDLHKHEDFHQLLLVLEGNGVVITEEQEEAIKSGSFYVFPANMEHGFQFLSPAVTLDFKFQINDPLLQGWMMTQQLKGSCTPNQIMDFKRWFTLSLDNSRDKESVMTLRIESGFKSSLIDLLLSMEKSTSRNVSHIKSDFPIARYLQEHMNERITLDDLAARFGFHPHYLIHVFRQHTGQTPIEYLQQLRLEWAREELEFTNRTITELADEMEWSLPYFSRLFKEKMGISPAKYREGTKKTVGKDIRLDMDFENQWRVRV